jgi:peptidylprolyl isomerase/peptidyl-prolyl cis-trans isomerase D
MGVMNKLRDNTGVILWILVISFGVIWTLQDSNVFETMGQQTRNIAVVNGAPVRYEQFQQALEQQRERIRQQVGNELTPRMEEVVQEQAYTQLVNQQLLQQEMDRLGISVTDDEVREMVFGDNPHPLIRQQFADSTGQINYQLIENLAQNPEMKQRWIQLEQFLREQRRQQKMNALVQATVHVSREDVERYYHRRNDTTSVRYVAMRYASVPNDSITVTDADLQSYYESNKEDYKRPRTYTLEYATRPKNATAEDSAAIAEDLRTLREEFAAAENDSLFLSENASDRSYNRAYRTADQLEASIADAIFQNPEPGAVVGPVFANEMAHLIKIQDTRPAESEYVHARHILLRSSEPDPAKMGRLRAIRDSIESGAASFAAMAREYSEDGTASEGGDLGWFGRGRMVPAFEEAAFNASAGELIGPIRSEFGYHLIRVEAKADQAVQFADLAYSLRPSQATLREQQNLLEDLAYFAEDEGGAFREEAERLGLEVQDVEVEAEQTSIPGIGASRSLTRFLDGAEPGEISSVAETDNAFVVAHVVSVQEEGYRPLDDVRAQVRTRVQLQKKREIQVRRMRDALRQNGFDGMAGTLGTRIRQQDNVTFATNSIPGIGRDPAFAGTIFGLEVGEVSSVVEGANAAYVIEVVDRQTPPELTPERRAQIRQQLIQQQQRQVTQQWLSALREKADIQDNRSQFQL